jgi:hypothetical protein
VPRENGRACIMHAATNQALLDHNLVANARPATLRAAQAALTCADSARSATASTSLGPAFYALMTDCNSASDVPIPSSMPRPEPMGLLTGIGPAAGPCGAPATAAPALRAGILCGPRQVAPLARQFAAERVVGPVSMSGRGTCRMAMSVVGRLLPAGSARPPRKQWPGPCGVDRRVDGAR